MENNLQAHTVLIQQAQRGNAVAMEALYKQYSKAMYNVCTRMMGDRNSAEDVLQDSFIVAFKNLQQLKDVAQFGGWLKRIVINECIRQGKKKNSWTEWDDDLHDTPDMDEASWWDTVGMAEIHAQIKALPDGCRQVFTLYAIENYSHKDIAASVGISESTSKSQYHRAKQLLKERLSRKI